MPSEGLTLPAYIYIRLTCILGLSAMIAGMDDAHKYVVIEYQSAKELDKTFENFMKTWL